MKSSNHIKSKNAISLRGIGKLGYTESGKLASTMRRLSATFIDEDSVVKGSSRKRIRAICPDCKHKTTVKNGRFVAHKKYFSWWTYFTISTYVGAKHNVPNCTGSGKVIQTKTQAA